MCMLAFEDVIDPGDNARIFHITTVGKHIPVLDSFIPKPLNPKQ